MNGGVFAVSRGIFDDPDYRDEPYTQREAVMWMIANAAWKRHAIRTSEGPLELDRGEFCFSIRFLAKKWKWTKSRVERFLNVLKNRDTLRDTKRGGLKVWKVTKYNDFQKVSLPRETQSGTPDGTAAGQQRDKEEDRTKQGNTSLPSAGARSQENHFDNLKARMPEMLNALGISDETKSPNLLSFADPLNWLEGGCDIDLDVLPTLATFAARRKPVNNWAYCTNAIFEAKAKREAPPPDVSVRSSSAKNQNGSHGQRVMDMAQRMGMVQ